MSAQQGPFGCLPAEGAFASLPLGRNREILAPFASALAGAGSYTAPEGGTIMGRFGWADPATGLVNNTRTSPADQIGIVLPYRDRSGASVVGVGWTWSFFDPVANAYRVREGLSVTLMSRGNFWLRFAGGAYYGQPVYASLVDGSAISGDTGGAELTPWIVCSNANPGCLAIVSSTAKFGA